jgi:hypothetical protein
MADTDDLFRYIEYLQRGLIAPGTEPVVEHEREWSAENRERLQRDLGRLAGEQPSEALRRLENEFAQFEPKTAYDSFEANQIFAPLVDKIGEYMIAAGIGLQAPVTFASSPALEPSPAARPSVHGHVLFAGRGTYAFCNYWAKLFTDLLVTLGERIGTERLFTAEDVDELLGETAVGQNAVKLSLYYALTGTVIGFGRMHQPEQTNSLRVAILLAMEAFIIGHEMAHFSAEEEYPDTNGLSPSASAIDLEIQCDAIALSMATAYGAERRNPFALHCSGPALLFWALKISEDARACLLNLEPVQSTSHPSLEDRLMMIEMFLAEVTHPDERSDYLQSLNQINLLGMSVNTYVQESIRSLLEKEFTASPDDLT